MSEADLRSMLCTNSENEAYEGLYGAIRTTRRGNAARSATKKISKLSFLLRCGWLEGSFARPSSTRRLHQALNYWSNSYFKSIFLDQVCTPNASKLEEREPRGKLAK